MERFLLYLFCLLFCTLSVSASCNSTSQCNDPYGHCQDGECFCSFLTSGANCEHNWRDDKSWSAVFWTYDAVVLLAHTIYVVVFSHQLYITFRYADRGRWTKWNVPTVAMICELIGSLARVTLFAGDPQNYREIYPRALQEILFTISLLLYLNAGMLLLLNLIEVMQQRGIEKLSFLRRFRWAFITFSFAMTGITTAVGLWRMASNLSKASVSSYNLTFGIACLVVLGVDILLGITVFKTLKQLSGISTKSLSGKDVNVFLWRLLKFTMVTSITVICGIIALIIYSISRGDSNRWAWLALNAIFRFVEIILLEQFYFLVRKRVPLEYEESLPTSRSRSPTYAETSDMIS